MTAVGSLSTSAEVLAEMLRFLQRTLPSEQPGAVYFISEQNASGRWRDHPIATIAEAARLALQFDAAGSNAYFALATFSPDSGANSRVRRTQKQAVALRSLFLDVDCCKPGAYATQAEAIAELRRFCSATGLPIPRIISSGKGLHLYWLMTEPVSRDAWQGAADSLSTSCSVLGFKADVACTADAARVLRPVGTHWRKNDGGPLPVRLLEDAPPTPFATVKTILDQACKRHNAAMRERIPAAVKSAVPRINQEFEVHHLFPAADANRIAENCAQIREMKDSGGRISEPRWYACLGVLVQAESGEKLAHAWSAGDPRYSYAETEGRLTRLREEGIGPTTCERFADLHPDGCVDCAYKGKIKSPIRLGYPQRVAPSIAAPPESEPYTPIVPPAQALASAVAAHHDTQRGTTTFGAPAAVEPLFDIESARAGRFIHTAPAPRIWLLKDCLPAGVVGGVVAPGGAGKTQAVMQLAVSVAVGLPFCATWETGEPGEVLVLLAEDDEAELHRRLHRIVQPLCRAHAGCDIEALIEQNLYIKSVVAEDNLLTALGPNREVQQTARVPRIVATARQLKNPKLIILDPVSRFRGGVENSAEDVTRFIEALERIRTSFPSATVIVVHHTNKWSGQSEEQTQGAARGSSAFSDGIRWQMNLAGLNPKEAARVPADERHMYLSATITKNNYAPPQPTVYLKRGEGGVLARTSLEDAAGKKGGNILLQIVARILDSEPMSADTFEAEFGGTTNVFGVGKVSLRGHIKQAIDAGYLTKAAAGREKPLVVTDTGRAALSVMHAAAATNLRRPIPDTR